jgi:hypothetical protein
VAAGVLKAKFGSNYEVGSAAKMLYPASGDKTTTVEPFFGSSNNVDSVAKMLCPVHMIKRRHFSSL